MATMHLTAREADLVKTIGDSVKKRIATLPVPVIDMTPVANAIRECHESFSESIKSQTELLATKFSEPPLPMPAPVIDMTPVANAILELAKIFQSLIAAMPQQQPPVVNVQPPAITVQVPEFAAPIVKLPRILKSVAKFKRDGNDELTESTTEHTYETE